MTIQEYANILQKQFPEFGKKIIFDQTPKGEDFCEMVYPNKHSSSHPLTVTVFEDGGSIAFGNMEKVTGEGRLSAEQIICAIEDIISDKIMFVFLYESTEKKEDNRLFDSDIFDISDDSSKNEYEKFIRKIKTPLNKFSRMLTPLKGVFVVRNFTGSINFEVTR